MGPAPDPITGALLALRLLAVADAPDVAERSGWPQPDIDRVLAHLDETGWARYRPGRFPGWMLTGHGRAEGERRLAQELDVTGARARTDVLYRRFLVLNPEVLRVASAWQVRTVGGVDVPNDHADEDHDAAVIAELELLHRRAEGLLAELESPLPRLAGYRPRLSLALARVRSGEGDWFVRPGVDSYHTVWFELHENLLATLWRRRNDGID